MPEEGDIPVDVLTPTASDVPGGMVGIDPNGTANLATVAGDITRDFFGGSETPATPPPDGRQTYVPPAQAWRAGSDAEGNPLFRLIDEGGDLIQWGIRNLGGVADAFGFQNLGKNYASPAGSALGSANRTLEAPRLAPANPATGTVTPSSSGGILSEIGSLLTGDTTPAAPGVTIAPTTQNYAPVSLFNDTSNRSSVVAPTTVSQTYNVNSADLVSRVVDSIAGIFRGGNAPVSAASSALPMNDAIFGRATTPATFGTGQRIDTARSAPNSNANGQGSAASISGLKNILQNENNRPLLFLGLAAVGLLAFLAFRRGR